MIAKPPSAHACAWVVEARHRVASVEAVGPQRAPSRLLEERTEASCSAMQRSYRLEGPLLMLCPDTCKGLQADGFDGVELRLECRE